MSLPGSFCHLGERIKRAALEGPPRRLEIQEPLDQVQSIAGGGSRRIRGSCLGIWLMVRIKAR